MTEKSDRSEMLALANWLAALSVPFAYTQVALSKENRDLIVSALRAAASAEPVAEPAASDAGATWCPGCSRYVEKACHHFNCPAQASMATASAEPVAWQPIETAPKDGTRVLLHTENPIRETIAGRWVGSPHNVWIADNGSYRRRATLWMMLPEPPK